MNRFGFFIHPNIPGLSHKFASFAVELSPEFVSTEGFGWKVGAAYGGAVESKVDSGFLEAGADEFVLQVVEVPALPTISIVGQIEKAEFAPKAVQAVPFWMSEYIVEH